jgi:hypothetical protein
MVGEEYCSKMHQMNLFECCRLRKRGINHLAQTVSEGRLVTLEGDTCIKIFDLVDIFNAKKLVCSFKTDSAIKCVHWAPEFGLKNTLLVLTESSAQIFVLNSSNADLALSVTHSKAKFAMWHECALPTFFLFYKSGFDVVRLRPIRDKIQNLRPSVAHFKFRDSSTCIDCACTSDSRLLIGLKNGNLLEFSEKDFRREEGTIELDPPGHLRGNPTNNKYEPVAMQFDGPDTCFVVFSHVAPFSEMDLLHGLGKANAESTKTFSHSLPGMSLQDTLKVSYPVSKCEYKKPSMSPLEAMKNIVIGQPRANELPTHEGRAPKICLLMLEDIVSGKFKEDQYHKCCLKSLILGDLDKTPDMLAIARLSPGRGWLALASSTGNFVKVVEFNCSWSQFFSETQKNILLPDNATCKGLTWIVDGDAEVANILVLSGRQTHDNRLVSLSTSSDFSTSLVRFSFKHEDPIPDIELDECNTNSMPRHIMSPKTEGMALKLDKLLDIVTEQSKQIERLNSKVDELSLNIFNSSQL